MSAPTGEVQAPAVNEKPPLITSTFILAWLINFTLYFSFYFVITIMALYAIRQFAASDAAAGFTSSAFVVGATVARIFSGFIVGRAGKRPVMLVALIVATLACALYVPANSLALLIIVRLVHGFGYAFASTAVMTIAQSAIPESRRAEGTGYFALGSTLAAAIGPALALIVISSFTYSVLFWMTTAICVLGLMLGIFLREPVVAESSTANTDDETTDTTEKPKFSFKEILHPAVIPIGVFMLLIGLCYSGVITYLNAYSEERDLVTGAGLFFIAYALAMFSMRFFLGRLQDQRGDNVVMYFGMVTFLLSLALLAVADADWQVVVAGGLSGLGFGTLMPASQSIAVSSVPGNMMGTGISTLLLLADIGIGLGPIFLGMLTASIGYGIMYALLAMLVIISGVFYQFTHGRKAGRKQRLPAPSFG